MQGALFQPLGRDIAPVGAGVQREVKGVTRQFEQAKQPVRLGLIPLQEHPRNAEVHAKPHERPERLHNARGVLVVPMVTRETMAAMLRPTGACICLLYTSPSPRD